MGCSGPSDCGYGRAGTSQHHLVLHIPCSGWDKECCHDVFKCFGFYPVVSVTMQTWESVFKLKQRLGKLLTAFNGRGWEIKPLAILIGSSPSLLFYFPKASIGHGGFIPGNEDLNWVSWYRMPSLISWRENVVFLSVASSSAQKHRGEGLPLLSRSWPWTALACHARVRIRSSKPGSGRWKGHAN